MEDALRKLVLRLTKERGLKHKFVANKVGIEPHYYSLKINGKVKFNINDMAGLAEFFGFSIDELAKKEACN